MFLKGQSGTEARAMPASENQPDPYSVSRKAVSALPSENLGQAKL